MRHTFSDGNWIDVLPIQALRAKHKDAVDAAVRLYVSFDDKGNPDLSGMPITMSVAKAQRNVLMSILITAWSFTSVATDPESGEPVPGTETALPVPVWHADGAQGLIENEDSFGEIEIDAFNEMELFFAPYMVKVQRRPDPKGTTTDDSSGTSRARAGHSRRA